MPSKTPSISVNKALLGTWITDEEDSSVAFAFSTKNNGYLVNGFCRSDGEEFEITRVKVEWQGPQLRRTDAFDKQCHEERFPNSVGWETRP